MLSKKKKIFILVGMASLLVITGVLNIWLNNKAENSQIAGKVVYADFFDSFKASRMSTIEETTMIYDAIISNPASSTEAIANAEAAKLAMGTFRQMENNLEQLISALGYSDVAVTCTSTRVNVIVKSERLTSNQVANIQHIVVRETEKTPSDISIYPVS